MDDLISRQAAIDVVYAYMNDCGLIDRNWHANGIVRDIEKLPSAQPERKKGKWVWLSSTYDRVPCEMRFMCSECHHETIVHTNGTSEPWENYCPNCGADMRKETEDAEIH